MPSEAPLNEHLADRNTGSDDAAEHSDGLMTPHQVLKGLRRTPAAALEMCEEKNTLFCACLWGNAETVTLDSTVGPNLIQFSHLNLWERRTFQRNKRI